MKRLIIFLMFLFFSVNAVYALDDSLYDHRWEFEGDRLDAVGTLDSGTGGTLTTTSSAIGTGSLDTSSSGFDTNVFGESFQTATIWVNLSSTGSPMSLFNQRDGSGGFQPGYNLWLDTANQQIVIYNSNNEGVPGDICRSNIIPSMTTDTWHLIGYVHNGGNPDFYFDGIDVGENPSQCVNVGPLSLNSNGKDLMIGGGGEVVGGNVDGLIDEPSYFNVALNSSQMQELFDEKPIPLPPLEVNITTPTNGSSLLPQGGSQLVQATSNNNVSCTLDGGAFTTTGATNHQTSYNYFANTGNSTLNIELNVTCGSLTQLISLTQGIFVPPPEPSVTASVSLTSTTGQLPQVGEDISGFLDNITPGVLAAGFFFTIIALLIGVIIAMLDQDIILIARKGK